MADTLPYIGRFAPSPTGPLHFGSLTAALGSYLQARSQGGRWLIRIEDLDPPREVPGAAEAILRTLEAYGFNWDDSISYQSRHHDFYQEVLERLWAAKQVYACGCTRKEIAEQARTGLDGPVYPGTCRAGLPAGRTARALRILTHDRPIAFTDTLQGYLVQRLENACGDFVVRRADGLFAYQLAVVVDDARQGVTEVVRGSDLLDSTPRQLHLQQLLGYPVPRYMHLPIAVNARGEKLSKQTRARALSPDQPVPALVEALRFLNQDPPPELVRAGLDTLWQWALEHWAPTRIPRVRTLPYPLE